MIKIFISCCLIYFAYVLYAEDNIIISQQKELKWAVVTFIALLPITAFFLYMLLQMLYKIFFFCKSTIKLTGEVLDFYVESVAMGGGTWHPIIQYYTPDKNEIIFIPDSTLMLKPKKNKKISIHILSNDYRVAELLRINTGFLMLSVIVIGFIIILTRAFLYAAIGEYATNTSRNIVIVSLLVCVLCYILLPLFQKIISSIFSLKRAIIVGFTPYKNKSNIITYYRARAKILQNSNNKPIDIGVLPVVSIGSSVLVYYDNTAKKYKPVKLGVFIFTSFILFSFILVLVFKYFCPGIL